MEIELMWKPLSLSNAESTGVETVEPPALPSSAGEDDDVLMEVIDLDPVVLEPGEAGVESVALPQTEKGKRKLKAAAGEEEEKNCMD